MKRELREERLSLQRAGFYLRRVGAPQLISALMLLFAYGCAACGAAEQGQAGKQVGRSGGGAQASGGASSTLTHGGILARTIEAPFNTVYSGTRVVDFNYVVDDVALSLSFIEEVGSDGQGNFAIEFVSFLQGAALDEEMHRLIQSQRSVFAYRLRDFRIRNYVRFNRNYQVTHLADDVSIAGLDCVELRVERQEHAEVYHEICVHVETGLLLRWKQHAISDDALMSRVEFSQIELGGSPEGLPLLNRRFGWVDLDKTADFSLAAGFDVLQPALLPDGYELEVARFGASIPDMKQGSRRWIRISYDDGLEPMVFMVGEPENGGATAPGYIVDGIHVGPWRLYQGEVNGYPLILMGQRSKAELLMVLQSALPF